MNTQDIDFQALKDITRLSWLINFEALATVPGIDELPLAPISPK
jgi:hypothetical protein